jgi:hypothetical protein
LQFVLRSNARDHGACDALKTLEGARSNPYYFRFASLVASPGLYGTSE